jgi:phage gpG-like protein
MVGLQLSLTTNIGGSRRTFDDVLKGLSAISEGIISLDKMDPIIRQQMRRYLVAVAEAMRQRHSTRWSAGTGPDTLSKRTGKLVSSIRKSIRVQGRSTDPGGTVGRIGSPLVYASTQEFGATIRPRRAQYLTIPLPAAMNNRGVMLFPKARDYPRTFVQMSRRGNLIIFQKRGRDAVPLFVLKREVKIPPRLNLGKALELAGPRFVDDVVQETLAAFRAGKL